MFTDAAWFHDYASHANIEVLKGRLQFANRTDNGYSPFGHGIFVFASIPHGWTTNWRSALSDMDRHLIAAVSRSACRTVGKSRVACAIAAMRWRMTLISIDREPTYLAMSRCE